LFNFIVLSTFFPETKGSAVVVPLLTQFESRHTSDRVLILVAFILGEIGGAAQMAIPTLCATLQGSRNMWIRRTVAESIGTILSVKEIATEENNKDKGKENTEKEHTKATHRDDSKHLIARGVAALRDAVANDEDEQVRFQACLSIAKVAPCLADGTHFLAHLYPCSQQHAQMH
jgi:hypothetical protein